MACLAETLLGCACLTGDICSIRFDSIQCIRFFIVYIHKIKTRELVSQIAKGRDWEMLVLNLNQAEQHYMQW